jgi:transposase-like protein
MASKGQKFRKHTNEFKLHVVHLRLVQKYSLRTVCRIYGLNSENVLKWTKRFLRGEPLTMKRGRPKKDSSTTSRTQFSGTGNRRPPGTASRRFSQHRMRETDTTEIVRTAGDEEKVPPSITKSIVTELLAFSFVDHLGEPLNRISRQDTKEELERLRAELAYKNKLIEFLEERETVKKKKNSESSGN